MAYNGYFPASYQPMYYAPQYSMQNAPQNVAQPQIQTPTYQQAANPVANAPQPSSGLIWVQGEAGAKSYLVAPNTTVLLMDSEGEQFFLKSADASGMPLPLRVFHYEEATQIPQGSKRIVEEAQSTRSNDLSDYVEKSEYEAFKRRIEGILAATPNINMPNAQEKKGGDRK